jgi:hypothetical protein
MRWFGNALALSRAANVRWSQRVDQRSGRCRHWFTMADIFISYSKGDQVLALKLSTFLESEGWTVWWDKGLGAADLYREEIMKQIAAVAK